MTQSLIAAIIIGAIAVFVLGIIAFRAKQDESEEMELEAPEVRELSLEEKKARGYRAKSAMDEFLAPALQSLEMEYLTALTTLASNEPWATDKITKLAVAQRVIASVKQQIIMSVMEGELASQELERAKKIAALPEAKRRFVNM